VGYGAANVAVLRLLRSCGLDPARVVVVDSKGILHRQRSGIEAEQGIWAHKWRACLETNGSGRRGGGDAALRGVDLCITCSRPGPGTVRPDWVASTAKDAIVFACANPAPEIWPREAVGAGARIVATGRSDFPYQLNNYLGFPAIFRGALNVPATTIRTRCAWPPHGSWSSVPRREVSVQIISSPRCRNGTSIRGRRLRLRPQPRPKAWRVASSSLRQCSSRRLNRYRQLESKCIC